MDKDYEEYLKKEMEIFGVCHVEHSQSNCLTLTTKAGGVTCSCKRSAAAFCSEHQIEDLVSSLVHH